MKIKSFIFCLFLSLISLPTFAAAEQGLSSCNEFATTMTKRVMDIFHDANQSEEQKRQGLSMLFQQSVDTDWIGKFVLGRYWKEALPQEQTQYLEIYKTYLTNSYVSKFNDEQGMSVDDIKIASITPQSSDQFEAKTIILHKNEEDVHVDYLLEQSPEQCYVHDIKVEGVSLVASQRSEFAAIAGQTGIKGVIAAMQKQID